MRRDEPADDAEGPVFPDDPVAELELLLELAVRAVPSCIGVTVILGDPGSAVAHSALRAGWQAEPVRASMSVRLPRRLRAPDTDSRAELRLYAGVPGAFTPGLPALLAVLDATARQVVMDAHLELPDLVDEPAARRRWYDEQAAIGLALGILLDRGLLPAEGRLELARLAALAGTTERAAAAVLIASVARDPG